MGIAEIIALITGIVKFLPEVTKLVRILQKSPAQRAIEISKLISDEADKLHETGRPTWGK